MAVVSQTIAVDQPATRVGIAGLGKMGSALAARLVESGCEVIAWNRDADRAREEGLKCAHSPQALAEACHVVISSLFDAEAVKAVYSGPSGLLAGAAGTLFIEMSTLGPSDQIMLSKQASAAGGHFIECPVSGTVGPARSGQLLGFAGGEPLDVERARPILNRLCRRLVHVGPVGAGSTTKLAVNLPLIAFWQSFGEAMALMRELNKDPAWLVDLFADTAGAPAVMKVKAEAIKSALDGQDVPPAFDINAMCKDLGLMQHEATVRGFSLPVASAVLDAMNEAAAQGWGHRDCACIPAFWAAKAKRPV